MGTGLKYSAVISLIGSFTIIGLLTALYFIKGSLFLFLLSAVASGVILALLFLRLLKLKRLAGALDQSNRELAQANGELAQANMELSFQKNRLDLVMEGSSEGFWDWNIATDDTYYSRHWYKILGYEPDEATVNFNIITQMIHPEDLPDVLETLRSNSAGQLEYYDREDRFITADGKTKWLLIRGKIVEYSPNGKPVRMAGIVKDITDKKRQEEEINYLSFHDKLTGLYNRHYFEKELEKSISSGQCFQIIMGDVNGLKLANDVFGHEEGDRLLQVVAEILVGSCRPGDIVARYGGDEFAMILKGADEEMVKDVYARIEQGCRKCIKGIIRPSIAVGSAAGPVRLMGASQLLKSAEEKMYRNKLLADRSIHSSLINSLRQALAEKHFDTDEHADRLLDMCMKVGGSMGMDQAELDQLALAAILHDIGKVAISDEILLKPGPLDEKEWEVMKHHTEIGYRIAKASPDLSHIAEAILAHHERYDGRGYPQGLSGEDIPVASRVLAVVDAYDAMTHKRPYREAISSESALEELGKCSGSQFDPEIAGVFLRLFDKTLK